MAARGNKRRATDFPKSNKNNDQESSEDNSSDGMDNSDQDVPMETINVDFEARSLEIQDEGGVQNLLRQLFVTEENIITGLSDILFAQQDIGSVFKQTVIPEDSDDDNDQAVFGLISAVNITERRNTQCVQQLRQFLITKARETDDDVVFTTINRIVNDEHNHVGFIVSDRIIGISSEIAPLMYESLRTEIDTAKLKKLPFNFAYYILISRVVKSNSNPNDRSRFVNEEDEFFLKDSIVNFEYELKDDAATEGEWDEEDLVKKRCVMLLKSDKFNSVVANMANSLEKKTKQK